MFLEATLQLNGKPSSAQRGSLSYSTRKPLLLNGKPSPAQREAISCSTGTPLQLSPPGRERGWRQWEEVRSLVRRLMPPPRIPSKAGNARRHRNHSKVSSANRTIHWYQRCQPPPKSPGPSKPTLSPPGRAGERLFYLFTFKHSSPPPTALSPAGRAGEGLFYLFTFKHSSPPPTALSPAGRAGEGLFYLFTLLPFYL